MTVRFFFSFARVQILLLPSLYLFTYSMKKLQLLHDHVPSTVPVLTLEFSTDANNNNNNNTNNNNNNNIVI